MTFSLIGQRKGIYPCINMTLLGIFAPCWVQHAGEESGGGYNLELQKTGMVTLPWEDVAFSFIQP